MTAGPTCRACAAPLTRTLVDLGEMPLANAFLASADEVAQERRYPLHARVCDSCFLVQVDTVVGPKEIFSDYAYFSSCAESWVAHAKRYAEDTTARLGLGSGSFVVEVASNDGYLLQHFAAGGIPVLGIEPAANVAAVAVTKGVRTEMAFFGQETAIALSARHGLADLIVANNVLAHVPDINDFIAGFGHILAPEGVATFEFPHLRHLIDLTQFDTIYHEHFSYLSLLATEPIMERHRLRVFDVEELPTHGGTLRLWVCHQGAAHKPGHGLAKVRADEKAARLDRTETYDNFGLAVATAQASFLRFLDTARADRRSVVGYGAAAKGNTLLNSCRVTAAQIPFVADVSVHKQGRLLPGSHIPVISPEALAEARPDYVLILPWNLRDEIMESLAHIREWGGRFVIPVPQATILP